jgi:toxin YoeB
VNLVFSDDAWKDYLYWHGTDRQTLKRIHELIKDVKRNPYRGIGKPEPLRHALERYWSRRITAEHRMVYQVTGGDIRIAQLRHHYRS